MEIDTKEAILSKEDDISSDKTNRRIDLVDKRVSGMSVLSVDSRFNIILGVEGQQARQTILTKPATLNRKDNSI